MMTLPLRIQAFFARCFLPLLLAVMLSFSLAAFSEVSAAALLGPPVVINELQTGSANSANEEFVEIKNIGEDSVDVTGWRLEYKSATGLTWAVKVTLSGELYPGGTMLLAANGYLSSLASAGFTAGLAKTGGNIRLASTNVADSSVVVHDSLAWGSGNAAEGSAPAPYPADGKSLQRKLTAQGLAQDTDNNLADFFIADTPTPEAMNLPPLVVEPIAAGTASADTFSPEVVTMVPTPVELLPPAAVVTVPGTPALESTPVQGPEVSVLLAPPAVLITELLPNPASPVTDGEGEFIELYNASDQPVHLQNYKLQTGLKSSYSYTIGDVTLEPKKYKVFYSKDTQLSLSNTSGKARLTAPDGTVISETLPYGTAKDGYTWNLADSQWVWSTTATPGADNVVSEAPANPAEDQTKTPAKAVAKTTVKAAAAKPAVKKAVLPKTTKTSTAKPKGAKAKKAAAKPRQVYKEPAKVDLKTPIHYGVLAVIGSITLLYAAYEYRTDFLNRLFQLRRYLAYRRGHRQAPQGE